MFDASDFPPAPRLLACGFGPFPGVAVNPAQEVLQALGREDWAPEGARLSTALLPVVWTGAVETALAAAQAVRADAVILFGVACEASCVRVETMARNAADADRLDAQGYCWPGRRLSPSGPESLAATLPPWRVLGAIAHEGVACAPSTDAGDYICNRTFWGVLAAGGPRTVFVHLPLPAETAARLALPCPSGMTLEQVMTAAKAALTAASACVRESLVPAPSGST